MTRNPAGPVPIDMVKERCHPNEPKPKPKPCRLWRKHQLIEGKPIIILVHGAVVPLHSAIANVNELHDPNNINNEKYCFYQLDSLLYNDFQWNVFTFEYADWPIFDWGSVNYHALISYGNSLKDAIRMAKKRFCGGPVGPVTVIAHSMGGW